MKKKIGYVLLTFMLTAFLCALIIAVSLYFYLSRESDSEVDIVSLADAGGATTIIYLPDGETELYRLHSEENRISVSSDEISDNIKKAFVAIEDHRFYTHCGVDIKRTAGAALSFLGGGSEYGGSTITQQLIKNLTEENQPTVKRKMKEIMRAVNAEKSLSKDEILTSYLNTVYLSEGCYGVETACQLFFSKSADEVSISQAATLAAIVKYPYYYDPIKYPDHNKSRRDTVLYRMFEIGYIDADEYDNAINESTELNISKKVNSSEIPNWFCETVIDEVCDDLEKEYGYTHDYAIRLINGGGLKIVTTVDVNLQTALEKYYAAESNFPTSGVLDAPESAAVIFDAHSGALLATVGSHRKKTSGRMLNPAFALLRSPGSSLKPLSVYAPAIDSEAVTWATVIDDVPKVITENDAHSGYYLWPKNSPRVYSGLTNTAHGIEQSKNTVAVDILSRIGTTESFERLKKLGISSLVESKSKNGKIYTDVDMAPLALGALTAGCSLYELTGAYTMLSDQGTFHAPHSYTAVYDKNGKLLLGETESDRMISFAAADIMTRMLENVVKSGTAKGMKISNRVSVAGKTGTSNANTDRWFIGYTPDYICGVWYGYRDGRDIGEFKQNPACTIFDGVMNDVYMIYPEKTKNTFPHSSDVIECRYCRDSGMLIANTCALDPRGDRSEVGYFIKGTEPHLECNKHIAVKYNFVSGGVACENCPYTELTEIALVKNYDRSFPCQITVTDAQYMYRFLPFGADRCLDQSRAFFEIALSDGEFCGTSGGVAYNRNCIAEHRPEPYTPPTEYEDDDLLSYLKRLFTE